MQIRKGKQFRIRKIPKVVDQHFRQKLLSMGLVPGAEFEIKRIAPLGDPIHINIHGYDLSLRKREFALFELEDIGGEK